MKSNERWFACQYGDMADAVKVWRGIAIGAGLWALFALTVWLSYRIGGSI